MRTMVSAIALCSLIGCFVSREDNSAYSGCDSVVDCDPGQACVEGFCVGGDGGLADADVDGGVEDGGEGDGGPPPGSCGSGYPEGCPTDQWECCGVGDAMDCVDMTTSTEHCGGCGIACGEGESCCAGQCRDEGAPECACTAGCGSDTCCGGTCRDTRSDREACGACGATCETGELCCDGACVPSQGLNCGACGVSCEAGEACCGLNGCRKLDVPSSCGSCGNDCGTGTCVGGACCGGEGSPERDCGGRCVDTSTDESNCGACGVRCGVLQSCINRTCQGL